MSRMLQIRAQRDSARQRLQREGHADDGTVKVWAIWGEDPNPDIHGPHRQPLLGVVRGTLAQAIEHSVRLDAFYTWGHGGNISAVTFVDLRG